MRRESETTTDGPSFNENAAGSTPDADTPEAADPVMPTDGTAATAQQAGATTGTAQTGTENGFAGAGVGGAEAAITALQAEVEAMQTRAEDAEKRLIYAQAEFQNVIKRKDEQSRSDQKYATSDFIKNLLPVLDNFERALKAAEQTKNYDALIGGVNGTLKQLMTALQKAGVTPIEALGKEFDPMYHEAIGHTESSEHPANTVAEEVQRGYLMHDRILRPTLVKVSEG